MSSLNLYKSYNFVDKDPIIDLMRGLVSEQKAAYARLSYDSGVSEATLRNWFDGKTKRPQFATVAAVMKALGYRQSWVLESNPAQVLSVTMPPLPPGTVETEEEANEEAAKRNTSALSKIRKPKRPYKAVSEERRSAAREHIRAKLNRLTATLP
jgi:DNA-binding phage protein